MDIVGSTPARTLLHNNLRQVVHILVPLSPSSTSNVTGHRRGPKRKLQAGYRALSQQRTCYVPSSHIFAYWTSPTVTHVIFFIVECGIARFVCAMHVFEVLDHPHPLGYLCAKLHFLLLVLCIQPFGDFISQGDEVVL